MRLRKIPNLLSGIKIKKEKWASDTWIFFNGVRWIDEDENAYTIDEEDEFCEGWEIYQEQQKKKHKFWLWAYRVKNSEDYEYIICDTFYDDNLKKTSGYPANKIECYDYIKLPHTEIEVEVDW